MSNDFLEIFCAATVAVMGSERYRNHGDHLIPDKILSLSQDLYAKYLTALEHPVKIPQGTVNFGPVSSVTGEYTTTTNDSDKVMYDRNKRK